MMFVELPGIHLQSRDIALLCGLFESRLMTRAHATALHFDGKAEACKKRIQRLIAVGLIGERVQGLGKPSILLLTWKGVCLLRDGGHLSVYPVLTRDQLKKRQQISPITIAHELEVMDVKAAFMMAIRATSALDVQQFTTWPKLCQFNVFHPATYKKVTVRPDAFLQMRETPANGVPRDHRFFLEVDRSSEVLDTIVTKVLCYLDYYKRGGLAVKYGHRSSDFCKLPFRVLLVCKSQVRLDHITERLQSGTTPIRTLVWLTTFEEVLRAPLGTIWVRPIDCAKKTRTMLYTVGTPYQDNLLHPPL